MIRFCANLSMLFTEVEFPDRFERAARAGFKAVEYLPYTWEKEELAAALAKNGLQQVLFNLPAGDRARGERGIACLPGREGEFRDGVALAIQYCRALDCPQVNCPVGIPPAGAPPEKIRQTLIDNLRFAATALEKEGRRLLVEPLNARDVPGFYLYGTGNAIRLIAEVGHPNLYLQYDLYHMQITEGNLMQTIQEHLGRIAHIQIADNPGRHEPGTGEINYPNIFRFLEKVGYAGWIGCEYKPLGNTEEGLAWIKPYL